MRAVLVANPKGGAGKTTLSTNLAGAFANQNKTVTLCDLDRQQSSLRWMAFRDPALPAVTGYFGGGQIVLNLGPDATNKLNIGNDFIDFQARFGGVSRELSIPVTQVTAIYSRENGAGMAFDPEPGEAGAGFDSPEVSVADLPEDPPPEPPRPEGGRPKLQRIK